MIFRFLGYSGGCFSRLIFAVFLFLIFGGCFIGDFRRRRVFAAAADPLPGVRVCGCARVSRARSRKSCACVSRARVRVFRRSWFWKIMRKISAGKKSDNKKRRLLCRRFDVYFILIFLPFRELFLRVNKRSSKTI